MDVWEWDCGAEAEGERMHSEHSSMYGSMGVWMYGCVGMGLLSSGRGRVQYMFTVAVRCKIHYFLCITQCTCTRNVLVPSSVNPSPLLPRA